jgi:hypothetical protein
MRADGRSGLMGELVNLRRARKAKTRADQKAEAAANRAHFGAPKAGRALTKARSEQEKTALADKRLDEPPKGPETD